MLSPKLFWVTCFVLGLADSRVVWCALAVPSIAHAGVDGADLRSMTVIYHDDINCFENLVDGQPTPTVVEINLVGVGALRESEC